ncbi:unnamed protein product [Prorocentrum cordatum]|uniref:Aminotransferase-like plant mobile domain-containing protein n=1 Tax=Prorocentrum cordatum TaxID=2364126 RepID=A0ABN9UMQ8_9DINO|nr:unnamed protein product [Polarella glacialis]
MLCNIYLQREISIFGKNGADGVLRWWQNAIATAPHLADHPAARRPWNDVGKTAPLYVHYDGAEVFRNQEYHIWSYGSVMCDVGSAFDRLFPIVSIPHAALVDMRNGDPDMTFMDFGPLARWRTSKITHEQFMRLEPPVYHSPWYIVQGITLRTLHRDLAHGIYLGFGKDLAASAVVLWLYTGGLARWCSEKFEAHNVTHDMALDLLFKHYRVWCADRGVTKCRLSWNCFTLPSMGRERLNQKEFPCLSGKVKAIACKCILHYLACVSCDIYDYDGTDDHSALCGCLCSLVAYVHLLDSAGYWLTDAECRDSDYHGRRHLQLYHALRTISRHLEAELVQENPGDTIFKRMEKWTAAPLSPQAKAACSWTMLKECLSALPPSWQASTIKTVVGGWTTERTKAGRGRGKGRGKGWAASERAPRAQVQAVQKVYSEWCVKATEIILASRVERPGPGDPSQQQAAVGATFQGLKVQERFDVRKEDVAQPEFFQLRSHRSFQVDIFHSGTPRDRAGTAEEEEASKFLERWTFSFFPAGAEPIVPDRHNQMLVRKLNVTLRSLLCFTRLLPGHSFCRSMRGGQLHWRFHVEGWPPTARGPPAQELATQDFASLQSSIGALRLSVSHRKELKAPPAGVQFKGTSGYSAQGDQIEVEEGYVTAPSGAQPASARGRLDKIAEEPDDRAPSPRGPGEPPAAGRQAAQHVEAGPSSARGAPPRRGSEESVGSNASASSRAPSSQLVRDQAVALGSTPPLAAACWPGQPPPTLAWAGIHGGDGSGPSSRTASPRISPKPGPVSEEDPSAALVTSAVLRQEQLISFPADWILSL